MGDGSRHQAEWGPRRLTSTGGAGVTLAGCSSSTRRTSRSTSARSGARSCCCSRRRPRCSSTRRGSCAPSTPTMPRPVVIRLVTYVKVPRDTHRRKITRRAVFARDGWTCQYCGSRSNLTVDHVIPRSKGGAVELGEHRRLVRAVQPAQGRPACRDQAGMHPRRHARARRARTSSSTSPARRSRRPGDNGCPRRAPWPTRPEWAGRRPSRRPALRWAQDGGRCARRRRAAARRASGWPTTCSCWATAASSCCAAGRGRAGSATTPTSQPRARHWCSSGWPARRCRHPSSWPPTRTRRPATSRRC